MAKKAIKKNLESSIRLENMKLGLKDNSVKLFKSSNADIARNKHTDNITNTVNALLTAQ